jgi:geranylgeranyl pyrophosphate synthase
LKSYRHADYKGVFAVDERKYQAYFNETREDLSLEISGLLPRISGLRLSEKILYALQSRGKLLRPTLVLLSGQTVGGKREFLKKLALSIELLHDATLVHDDILDNDHFRRDTLAVHSKWGVKSAILVGDALASLSLNLSAEYDKEVSKVVSQACLLLCDGEYMDAAEETNQASEQNYLEKIKKKCASLFMVAAQCGAVAGGGTTTEVESLAKFGENYGMAYQMSDDLSDIISLKGGLIPSQNDLQTLPLIHLYEATGKKENNFQNLSPENLYEVLENFGCIGYCFNKAKDYLNSAVENLERLRDTVYKSYLIRMADDLRLQISHLV